MAANLLKNCSDAYSPTQGSVNQDYFLTEIFNSLRVMIPAELLTKIESVVRERFSLWAKSANTSFLHVFLARKKDTGLANTIRVFVDEKKVREVHVVLWQKANGSQKVVKEILVAEATGVKNVAELSVRTKDEKRVRLSLEEIQFRQRCLDREVSLVRRLSERGVPFLSQHRPVLLPGSDGQICTVYQSELAEKDLSDIFDPPLSHDHFPLHIDDIIRQLGVFLRALHREGFCHLDLNPNNILSYAGNKVSLCDFGLAAPFGQEIFLRGSPGFIPPELLQNGEKVVNPAMDMWSFGVCIYMLTYRCENPFVDVQVEILKASSANRMDMRNEKLLLFTKKLKETRNSLMEEASEGSKWMLIGRLLSPDFAERPSADDVLRTFQKR